MKTIIVVSWRNVWRNKPRSLTILMAIAVGLWGGIFATSISAGMMKQRFTSSIETQVSHIQVHNPQFLKDDNIRYGISRADEIERFLAKDSAVKAFSSRTLVSGMIATATQSKGVRILGINPVQEAATTRLSSTIIDGYYLSAGGRNPILIGKKLADKLKLKTGSRIILTFTDTEGEIVSASFRVQGIIRTNHSMLDETQVYVRQNDLQSLTGGRAIVNEIAVLLHDLAQVTPMVEAISGQFPENEIRFWGQLSPDLLYMNEMAGASLMVLLVIIMLALAFGLLNTMLMTVFERTRELGMLMAVGMNKIRVFAMILLETTFLTITGALAGGILSGVTIYVTSRNGIDFSGVGGDTLSDYGISAIVYPELFPGFTGNIVILVLITSVLSALYPALKALKLKPSEAIRQ
ncbi:MAG: ABC transporter permease [Bacteroidales bacterium]|nr:ABC transporter permease [Bacteroidales bacterium]